MLERLELKAFGPIDNLCLDFEPGFIAVTGETGAGKSLVLGALRFLSGERSGRSERTLIPEGAAQAWAQVVLKPTQRMEAFVRDQGLAPCEERQLFLTRVVTTRGPSKAYINGQQVPLTVLQSLGDLWIDFHDPGAPKSCFDPKEQLKIVDTFGAIHLDEYARHYEQLRSYQAHLEHLTQQQRLDPGAIKKLETTLERMSRLDLSDAGIEDLEGQSKALDKAQLRQEHAYGLYQVLETKILDACRSHAHHAQSLKNVDPRACDWTQRFEQIQVELQDLAQEVYQMSQEAARDLHGSDRVEAQLEVWLGLKHAYGPSPEAVRLKQKAMLEQLELQSTLEGRLLELEHVLKKHETACWEAAQKLHRARTQAASALQAQVVPKLALLGLEHASLTLLPQKTQTLGPQGADTLTFLFAPNPGHASQPLEHIASSGESARVHLAFTSILSHQEGIPVLVFDEVDANVGGEIARCVGRELAILGKTHQVLCITHLPQVAAQASQHYCVTKSHTQNTTHVDITGLHANPQARKNELARMLGDRHAPSAQRHAQALIEALIP